jgi:hypothetical protein
VFLFTFQQARVPGWRHLPDLPEEKGECERDYYETHTYFKIYVILYLRFRDLSLS